MPKRKSSRTREEDLRHVLHKIRKLERKMRDRDKNNTEAAAAASVQPAAPVTSSPAPGSPAHAKTGTLVLDQSDWLQNELDYETSGRNHADAVEDPVVLDEVLPAPEEISSAPAAHPPESDVTALDAVALEILGENPSVADKHGKDILPELACRFQHIATSGLDKDTRKELTSKYLVPSNCLHVDAPKTNPEIKAAIPENIAKRERGLEARQKQMANAISCLGGIITSQINSKDKDKELLQKLMDLGRLLCDIQHRDSIIRRNFILFCLKKDIKEHLSNTKIDSFLFSETLSDTLKSVKTINKSGSELKAESANKNTTKKPSSFPVKSLNRKTPGAAYRPPPQPARSHEPAAPRAQPHAHSSKTSFRQPAAKAAPPPSRRRY